jgi:hypothetical protein
MSIDQLFSIPEEEIISLIKDDIDNEKISTIYNYVLYDYKFHNILTNGYINKTKKNNEDVITLKITVSESYKELHNKTFDSIDNMLKFLLNIFREEYKYSKITDYIENKNELEKKEKLFISKKILCKNVDKEDMVCSVCFDVNSIFTDCNHNLCRICYEKIKSITYFDEDEEEEVNGKQCPICRKFIEFLKIV